MDRTYGYDECEIELNDRALYGYNSDDFAIIEHTDGGKVIGYAILLQDTLDVDDISAEDVIEYFENIADSIDAEDEE